MAVIFTKTGGNLGDIDIGIDQALSVPEKNEIIRKFVRTICIGLGCRLFVSTQTDDTVVEGYCTSPKKGTDAKKTGINTPFGVAEVAGSIYTHIENSRKYVVPLVRTYAKCNPKIK